MSSNNKINIKSNNTPINLGDTANINYIEWLNWREHGPEYQNPNSPKYIPVTVGGSFVSAIYGLSPWISVLEAYNIKKGIQPKIKAEENLEAKEAGHIYEPYVADMFVKYMAEKEHTKVEIWNDTCMYQHSKYKFALANLDRRIRINGEEGILECKTTNSHNYDTIEKWQNGKVPIYYELQCRYYMEIMDINYCYICCLWGFLPSECAVIRIDRNKIIGEEIMKKCNEFVNNVINGIEPSKDEQNNSSADTIIKYYERLYGIPEDINIPIELDSDKYGEIIEKDLSLCKEIKELESKIKALEKERLNICTELYPVLLNNKKGYIQLDDNIIDITLKIPMHKEKFNEKLFKETKPKEYACYTKEVIDMETLEKYAPDLKEEFTIPATINTDKGKFPTLALKERFVKKS